MAVELSHLLEKVKNMDVTLVAGEKGLHNLVSWVHMVETTEASDFLDGREIAFTTGLGLGNNFNLLNLLQLMYQKNVSGVMVNTGPFIEKISQDAIDFCNANDFPLFVIPWKIHLAEVMRIFCLELTKAEQQYLQTAAAFKSAILYPKQEELYVVPLSQQGFRADCQYSVSIMSLSGCSSDFSVRLDKFAGNLDTYARHKYDHFAIFTHESDMLIITADYTEAETKAFIQDLYLHSSQILASGESIAAGCGKVTQSIRCLWKSYKQAKSIQKLQQNGKCIEPLLFYSDMGIYKLLMSIDDKDIIEEYYAKTILPLLEYDEKNDSDLTIVLRTYLNHNGSVKETADELYVHRNTINYKLTRISELLNMDLSLLDTRLQLSVAFMLEDML